MNIPHLNWEIIRSYYGDEKRDIISIFEEYTNGYEIMISEFKQANTEGNHALSKCAHRYAPGFSYTGFPDLTTQCRELENKCIANAPASEIAFIYTDFFKNLELSLSVVQESIAEMNKQLSAA